MNTQRCVCVDWLAWSRMGCFLAPAAGGRERRQQGREHAQEDREDNNETTPTSSMFMFIPHSEHATIAILLSTFMSCPSDLALHRLDRPNACYSTSYSTTDCIVYTQYTVYSIYGVLHAVYTSYRRLYIPVRYSSWYNTTRLARDLACS